MPTLTDECAKSKTCSGFLRDLPPPYLNNTEPLELEDLPLQVSLLTMELASHRRKMAEMARLFREMAELVNPDLFRGIFD